MRRGRFPTWLLVLVLAFAAVAGLARAAAPTFPALTGRVVDDAHVLPAATIADLTAKLAALEAKTSRQLVVVTLPSLQGQEIEEYGYQLGRAWGIGQGKLNNGALLIVAPSERRVRIEVGYGLEGVLTDALSSVILQTRVLPKFKAGDIPGGVVDGTNALIEQLSADPSTAEQRVAAAAAQQAQARGRSGGSDGVSPVALIFVFLFVMFALRSVFGRRTPFGGGGMGGLWLLPLIFSGGGRRGGFEDGGFGGGGGGGGFSGGGGSFGGGGASGSW